MPEDKADGLGTTSRLRHAQSMYHCECQSTVILIIVIVNSGLPVYLFQENKSYGSKKPFAFILWCTRSRFGHSNNTTNTKHNKQAEAHDTWKYWPTATYCNISASKWFCFFSFQISTAQFSPTLTLKMVVRNMQGNLVKSSNKFLRPCRVYLRINSQVLYSQNVVIFNMEVWQQQ